uniref:Uncharacterized protein n=1 Tax=Arundo donax TaxID=35708 RepID=A0A0A9GJR7_ARUDO
MLFNIHRTRVSMYRVMEMFLMARTRFILVVCM